jgi:phosphoribosyl-ATP pyrophosphohydrolase
MEIENKAIGYHLKEIKKGVLGKSSKLLEEVEELIDAEEQDAKIMVLIELSDLVGAIKHYLLDNKLGLELKDLEKMADITSRAFQSGRRK